MYMCFEAFRLMKNIKKSSFIENINWLKNLKHGVSGKFVLHSNTYNKSIHCGYQYSNEMHAK